MIKRVRMDKAGRITIPKEFREKLGLREGLSILELELKDNTIVVKVLSP